MTKRDSEDNPLSIIRSVKGNHARGTQNRRQAEAQAMILQIVIISTPEWNHLGIMLQYPLRLLVKSDAFLTEHEKDYTKLPVLVIEDDGMSFHKSGSEQSKRDALKNAALEKAHIPLLRLSTDGSFSAPLKLKIQSV